METVAIILAAGKGTRMKSSLPKVLHKIGGKPMVEHVICAAKEAGAEKQIVVIGHGAEAVREQIGDAVEFAVQEPQLGTGHAVMQTEKTLKNFQGTVLVLCGDTPLLNGEELAKFIKIHKQTKVGASVLTTNLDNPFGYGRIIRDTSGDVVGIVEEKDATAEQKAVKEINTGIYCLECPEMFNVLKGLSNNNAQGEYYLTDVLGKLRDAGKKIGAVTTDDADMVMGINSRCQLAEAEQVLRQRILNKWMDEGVTIMDPASTFIEADVQIGNDTIIRPFTWLEGKTQIGSDCEIGPNARLTNVKVGTGTQLQFIYAHDCSVGDNVTAGPFVHLRPDTEIGNKVKIGNFIEVKNSKVGVGSKLPHLSYIGDTDMGGGVNVGCGSIMVNYDGKTKHRTIVEDDVFIGCNSNLVAPVKLGKGSFIGAGSTITKDVPEGALAVARGKQTNIADWAKKYFKE
ncbi:MAG: bifunctional UDP-N-acetylglucosamine diphosphorylase/glucosamine-1-phosphate N-acetyltransferase GlmU [Acidaminococcaceae bacterium]|nr:bifunctional UDP-N-acetylglucosamine diphosphorylase/glucosamine-1-phosphate N-acetyltransferase GlmU [Acidaminococcaceae bacterium]